MGVLPAAWRNAHRAILSAYAASGRPPGRAELAALPGIGDVAALLGRLAGDDLAVLDADGEIAGAYPFTSEATPHRVAVDGVAVHAMCAVDALAMAPMLGSDTTIDSACAASGRPTRVAMRGEAIVEASPATLRVGIHWAAVSGHTAHGLCRNMVFLADAESASSWRDEAPDARIVYSLAQATDLGAAFFVPLLP
jgi:mercuric reductase